MDSNNVYCEVFDLEEEEWVLCSMSPLQALTFQLMLGGKFFHYVDKSMIDFQED